MVPDPHDVIMQNSQIYEAKITRRALLGRDPKTSHDIDHETVTFLDDVRIIIGSDDDVTINDYIADYLDLMKEFYNTNRILLKKMTK